jgi:hypothetical protein
VRFAPPKVWKGVIGARSPSAGGAPIEALAAAARGVRRAFLAHPDPVGVQTAASCAALQAVCAAASTPACAVFAGVSFADRYRDLGPGMLERCAEQVGRVLAMSAATQGRWR